MAKVGYIFKANSYDALDADKEWMRQYGCVQVVEEECAHEALRPQWKQLMASLGRGDELVVAKFSNAVRDLRGLAALVELCRIKVVRLVSIHDKIDTLGELFPDTTAAQVLEMFGALPEEVAVLRKSSSHIMQLQKQGVPVLEATLEGVKVRLRPVLMTALVAMVGFLPLVFSHGTGAEVQRPLATVVLGGLCTSTILTLVVLPTLYTLINRNVDQSKNEKEPTRKYGAAQSLNTQQISAIIKDQGWIEGEAKESADIAEAAGNGASGGEPVEPPGKSS